MYVSKVDLLEAILIEHRSNAFLDTRAQYCLEFYFQRYENDSFMIDFHLSKLLKLLFKINAQQSTDIYQGSHSGTLFFFDDELWKKEYLVFLTFKDNSLALDQLPAFVSSIICHSSVLSFVRQFQSLLKFEVKDKIPRFPSFRYWVSAKVKNWETSGMSIFLLKSYHNLFVTFQNLK